ncbi:Cysteine-rich receptor-like protein kinase 42 [Striga hermonthica]|uniref:Oleosin n=1 Tax=Striga hermonthica TaxID=68872 RepID=A0A9N7N0E8_STRHE|nr:Cysteine-rich receptor-like protein kinase 42 [Striga hermonthica]
MQPNTLHPLHLFLYLVFPAQIHPSNFPTQPLSNYSNTLLSSNPNPHAPPPMADRDRPQPHQIQIHPQPHYGRYEGGAKSLLPQKGPSTGQILAVVALLPVTGTLLALAGLTLAGSLVGLAVATPLFVIFSPVLVPAAILAAGAVAAFMTSGAFGLTGLSSLSWVVNSFRQATGKEPLDYAKQRLQEGTVYVGEKTKQVGETIKSKAAPETGGREGVTGAGLILAITLPVMAFCMLCIFGTYAVYIRWKKRKQECENLGKISYSYNKSNLNFKYETLEKATNYFDNSRKLGQGGGGSVYKGILSNGKTVAVKRLFFSTRQWVDEFFNEVNLISGIEHKNLAKLLGCSIEGPESLLVYEFVPNRSLEEHLFDTNYNRILSWKERFKIIVGTAEGIGFLHGGCEHRIIHRDIKSSNILLDENFEPKIADFGLARCFAADKTHLSTGIAGTLGYMAPEYLVKGQLTEKADVYSYGVLVIEIVCSKKNNAFMEGFGSLLQTVWDLFKADRLLEAVDPCLQGNFLAMEASKALRVGLLCAQASVAERPSMLEVVRMLTDENCEIPEPKQPPFLHAKHSHAMITTKKTTSDSEFSEIEGE